MIMAGSQQKSSVEPISLPIADESVIKQEQPHTPTKAFASSGFFGTDPLTPVVVSPAESDTTLDETPSDKTIWDVLSTPSTKNTDPAVTPLTPYTPPIFPESSKKSTKTDTEPPSPLAFKSKKFPRVNSTQASTSTPEVIGSQTKTEEGDYFQHKIFRQLTAKLEQGMWQLNFE
jgi:hypothetical protein